MPNARINGEAVETNHVSITNWLTAKKIKSFVVIEYNGTILKMEDRDKTFIKDGDNIEIINFVGGG